MKFGIRFRSKKGFLLTSVAVLISISLISIMFSSLTKSVYDSQEMDFQIVNHLNSRFMEFDNFVRDSSVFVSKKCLNIIADRSIYPSKDLFEDDFRNCFINSSFDFNIENYTFTNLSNKFITYSNDYYFFESNLTFINVSLNQTRPDTISVTVELNYYVKDTNVIFNVTKNVTSSFDIINLKNPLDKHVISSILTLDSVDRRDYIDTSLVDFINSTDFVADVKSPTYLSRFWGSVVPSDNGILYLLNASDTYVYENRTFIDFEYYRHFPTEFDCHELFVHPDNVNYTLDNVTYFRLRDNWGLLAGDSWKRVCE